VCSDSMGARTRVHAYGCLICKRSSTVLTPTQTDYPISLDGVPRSSAGLCLPSLTDDGYRILVRDRIRAVLVNSMRVGTILAVAFRDAAPSPRT
jgi:hypothetical protein